MKLYLFNPDSDLALANNEANYIAGFRPPYGAGHGFVANMVCRSGQCGTGAFRLQCGFLEADAGTLRVAGATGHRA
jgi:hypothetical protein